MTLAKVNTIDGETESTFLLYARLDGDVDGDGDACRRNHGRGLSCVSEIIGMRRSRGSCERDEKETRNEGAEVGGTWSCCLPCAGGGGGGGGGAVSGATPEAKKGTVSTLKHHQQHHQQQHHHHQQHQPSQQLKLQQESPGEKKLLQQQQQQKSQEQQKLQTAFVVDPKDRAPLGGLDEDLDDLEDEEKECELRTEEEDFGREGGTQHRLSPRLHDIEEEDEECRNTRERPYQKKSPTPSGGGGSRTGWRSRRSVTTAGAPGHQHHVIASAAATAQARMQAEQGSIGELRGYHNLRSRRHTLANVR
ncbi:hypothetical protein KPH14_009535 [Odynerus spinipes]|uniref:Uncharacterized protein n=1 Tax=Odynerus spinipes TaxID=1348599 RepID=A0AAD9VRN6_9HYME|nr:hypothetical protein KPH14_009535 [Odynerus spinipes]